MEINDKTQNHIDTFGWSFLNVFDPNGENPDFSYSIGFEETFNFPEIMIFGLDNKTAHQIISDIAQDLKDGIRYELNKKHKNVISGDFEVEFKEVKKEFFSSYLGTAVDFYRKPFRAWVLFWPDKNNILPIEKGCEITVQNEALDII